MTQRADKSNHLHNENQFVLSLHFTSLVAQTVKHLPTMWETRVQFLGQEDLLEKKMATHSSIFVWKIPWTEEPGRPQLSRIRLNDFTFTFFQWGPMP